VAAPPNRFIKRSSKSENVAKVGPHECLVQSRIELVCNDLKATFPSPAKRRSFTKNSLNPNNRVLK
jgi:hypothetical protein